MNFVKNEILKNLRSQNLSQKVIAFKKKKAIGVLNILTKYRTYVEKTLIGSDKIEETDPVKRVL